MYSRIGVVGLGYVGLTLTAVLADRGYRVAGVDRDPAVPAALRRGRMPLVEPGVERIFADATAASISLPDALPEDLDAVVICVSTPIDERTRRPDLTNLAVAAGDIAQRCRPGTLVVVRSTVPVGTTRRVVLPPLAAAWGRVHLVVAPERTIQGQALRELVELPQVIGGLDDASLRAGEQFLGGVVRQLVPVSSLETAEMIKLSNNCHTDLIYAFGNEVALICEQHGLDPLEVIHSANLDYPRPSLARPGYVGGGCLSKDPYLMIDSARARPPVLIGAARELNEYLPGHVARTVVDLIRQQRGDSAGARLAVLGWAYKGRPVTDDMRGTPIDAMMGVFRAAGLTVLGHDPVVGADAIRRHGGEPIGLDQAFRTTDAVLVVNDHPDYRAIGADAWRGPDRPSLVYDSWRILDERSLVEAGIRYAGIGYLAHSTGAGEGRPQLPVPA